jgi:hypothetical protein
MTAAADLGYLDARHYQLIVTLDHNGTATIEHQAGTDTHAHRQMAVLAAEIIDQVGAPAVARALHRADIQPADLDPHTAPHPGLGVAVLACRCGNAIDQADMRRAHPPRATAHASRAIRPITCPECTP